MLDVLLYEIKGLLQIIAHDMASAATDNPIISGTTALFRGASGPLPISPNSGRLSVSREDAQRSLAPGCLAG